MAAPIQKIQLFGHSFVKRLKHYIMNTDPSKFTLRLDGPPLIQYSGYPGAKIQDLHRHLDVVKDFAPDLVILVIGTNYLCDQEPATVLYLLQNLIDRMLHELKVPKIIIKQTLHRTLPSVPTRHRVNISVFNQNVDHFNISVSGVFNTAPPSPSLLLEVEGLLVGRL